MSRRTRPEQLHTARAGAPGPSGPERALSGRMLRKGPAQPSAPLAPLLPPSSLPQAQSLGGGPRFEEADFSSYNATPFAGLENDLANCYANALLQAGGCCSPCMPLQEHSTTAGALCIIH